MRFASQEDRLNPVAPEGTDEATLGGYRAVHGRAATFQGSDGYAYSAAIETEPSSTATDASEAFSAYLIFLRWAHTGSAVLDHLETEDLVSGRTEKEALAALERMELRRVKRILDRSIREKAERR